jgi:hypothetical protein
MKKKLIVTRKDVCKASQDKGKISLVDLKIPTYEIGYADVIIFREKNQKDLILKDRFKKIQN